MRSIQVNSTLSRRTLLLGMVGSVAQLTGCGGGGSDVAGLSSGGTGSFTSGTISGLGSIIVNGIRYKDATATKISRDDDTVFGGELKVGMVVSIQGSPVDATTSPPTATAYSISCGSEWQGPVSSVNVGTSSSFVMLGLTVDVLAGTVFEGAANGVPVTQLSDLFSNQLPAQTFAEVHGYVDERTGNLQATHVEVSTSAPTHYKLSGLVVNLNTGSQTFNLGSITQPSTQINWYGINSLPTNWADGVFVRVRMAAATPLTATQIRVRTSPLAQLETNDDHDAEIHGFISAYQSDANFTVNGIPVDASTADISGGSLAVGRRVEIHGSISNGVLIATKVETPSDASLHEFEFHGTVSALDATAQTFNLHGLTFKYDTQTSIQGLVMADGVRIEIKATRSSGAWLATEIRADD